MFQALQAMQSLSQVLNSDVVARKQPQMVNKWVGPRSNKTLFMDTNVNVM